MEHTLASVRQDLLDRLTIAAQDRHSPMHTPVVATADADARIMVLRDFDAQDWTLRFHTDRRAPKVGVIGDGSPVGVLFYDREEKVQIRCRGRGWIEEDTALADASWKESDAFARRCYLGAPPGELREEPSSGLPDWVEGKRPSEEELTPARPNFAILRVQVESADWYYLSNDGHVRAVFEGDKGRWLTP